MKAKATLEKEMQHTCTQQIKNDRDVIALYNYLLKTENL